LKRSIGKWATLMASGLVLLQSGGCLISDLFGSLMGAVTP
jgi:hypothetical protein